MGKLLQLSLILCSSGHLACGDGGGAPADTVPDTPPTSDAAPADVDTLDAGDLATSDISDSQADVARDSGGDALPALADAPMESDPAEAISELPVLDPNGDSDGDGIFDLVEVDDGTDPFDPRSARAWHPEIVGHPRLFVRAADQPLIAGRAAADSGWASTLWTRVLELASRPMPDHPVGQDYDTTIPPAQAQIAEAAALVGFATSDPSMAAKALGVLAAPFPDPAPLNELSLFNAGDHYDLFEADALQGFCSAYDLAAGTEGVPATALAEARAKLLERIDLFRKLCMTSGGCTTLLGSEPNNHAIKALAALGTCAMAIPDRPTAAADFNEALSAIDWLAHERQGNAEGGWAESWNYLSYSGETHLGFLLAVHVAAEVASAGSGDWRVGGEGWVTRKNERNGQLIEVKEPTRDPLWRAVYERALFAAQPSGLTPPVDDANPSLLHGGLLAALFDDGRYLWNWELPRVGLYTGRQLVATFLALDPTLAPLEPSSGPDGFFAEAGFSVMRSALTASSSYFHMQHEKDRMRLLGGSHEHADPLSFILVAFGEDLAIDPGYIRFAEHAKVKYGKDHNIVLVDGQGPEFFLDGLVDSPPNSDAFLHSHESRPPFTTLIASTKYAGAELRRRAVRVTPLPGRGDVFIIADSLIASGTPTWTFQLNGLASSEIGLTAFEMAPTEFGTLATWSRPAASLFAAVAATVGPALSGSRLEESALERGRHACLTVDAVMGANAGFLALLVPAPAGVSPALRLMREPLGVTLAAVVLDDGFAVTAYLNLGAETIAVQEGVTSQLVEPGLTVVVTSPEGEPTVGHWTMVTPPIPDPTPFLP